MRNGLTSLTVTNPAVVDKPQNIGIADTSAALPGEHPITEFNGVVLGLENDAAEYDKIKREIESTQQGMGSTSWSAV